MRDHPSTINVARSSMLHRQHKLGYLVFATDEAMRVVIYPNFVPEYVTDPQTAERRMLMPKDVAEAVERLNDEPT